MKPRTARFTVPLALAALLTFQSSSNAQIFNEDLTIDLPNLELLPGMGGQSFDIYVNNEGSPVAVNGLYLNLLVADGGIAAGGEIEGPKISDLNLVSETIFQENNSGHFGTGGAGTQLFEVQTATTGNTTVDIPTGNGIKIATVTFDTTGIAPGTYAYTLDPGTLNLAFGSSPSFFTIETEDPDPSLIPVLHNGTLTVVPEPGTTALFAGILCLGAGAVYRARKGRS